MSLSAQEGEAIKKQWEESLNLGVAFFKTNNFLDAKTKFKEAIKLSKELSNSFPWAGINTKYFYAATLFRLNDFDSARANYEAALKGAQETSERNIEFEILVKKEIIGIISKLGNYQEAITKHKSLNDFIKNNYGENSEFYAGILTSFGQLYFSLDDCESALRYYKKAEIIFNRLGIQTQDVSILNNNLGLCYFQSGNYIDTDNAYSKAFDILEKVGFEDQIYYSKLLSNISALGLVQGDYDNAKILQQRSLEILFELNLHNSIDYADGLFVYSQLLKELGKFDNALYEANRVMKLYLELLPSNHLKFANVYNILGELYLNNGNTKLASKNYNDAYNLLEKSESQNSPAYGYTMLGLGYLNQALGDYDKSLEYYISGANHLKTNFSEKHKDYGIALMNIGGIYRARGDYQTAYTFLETAIDIIADSIGTDNTTYGQLCVMILQVAFANPEETLSELEFLADYAIKIFSSKENINNLFYNYAHFFKAVARMENKEYQEAVDLLLTVEKEIKKDVEESSQLHNNVVCLIAVNYQNLNDFEKAFSYYKKANKFTLQSINEIFSFRSEKDKKSYLKTIENWFSNVTSISMKEGFVNSELTELSLNNQLLRKGLLLNSSKDILTQLESLKNDSISALVKEYKSFKDIIIYLGILPELDGVKEVEAVKNDINRIETQLVELYNENFDTESDFNKDWKTIKSSLRENEVAIEFVSYINSELVVKYIAYLIKSDSKVPEVVTLFDEQDLKNVLSRKTPRQLYATRGSKGKSITVSKSMSDIIWEPLERFVGNAETIYYSPVGLLNQIPFAAISTKESQLLSEKYNLLQLSSTSLLSNSFNEPNAENTLFVGGVDYEFVPSAKIESKKDSVFEFLKSSKGTRSLGANWDYLPGTLKEVKELGALFKQNNKTYSSLTKKAATEETFKALSGKSPNILHIATHGFFFENLDISKEARDQLAWSQESVYRISEDPLMRSGLILAGANYAWEHNTNPHTKENGILTALEISNLDLSNTDMVVLSACDTGLGDIDGSEGVYGLQRAFKMAGVDIIVMSLWEVPDKETAEFMKLLYSNWLGGMKVREAFNTTQRTMSAKYKDSPEKWAAFVLFE